MTQPTRRLDAHSRAAYRLALHATRADILARIIGPEEYVPDDVEVHARMSVYVGSQPLYLHKRETRVRWCLWLRAILRADAGDCGGRLECMECGDVARVGDWPTGCQGRASGMICAAEHVIEVLRIDALWSLAPATGTATRPAGLRRRDT